MRTSCWQLSSLQTTNSKPQLALQGKCPVRLLSSGSKISRLGLGTRLALKAGTLCLAYWWGGNTSILDKVCFSGSNLLMPLSALQSNRGSVTHQAVKTSLGPCWSIFPAPSTVNQREVGHWISDYLDVLSFSCLFYLDVKVSISWIWALTCHDTAEDRRRVCFWETTPTLRDNWGVR